MEFDIYKNYSVAKEVLQKSDFIKSFNEDTCDSIFQYAEFKNENYKNFSLEEKKLFLIDSYLYYSLKEVNYSKILFPSEELLSQLIEILEEILEEALCEVI